MQETDDGIAKSFDPSTKEAEAADLSDFEASLICTVGSVGSEERAVVGAQHSEGPGFETQHHKTKWTKKRMVTEKA